MSLFSIFNRHPANDLAAYVDGELSIARRAKLDEHLDGCPSCAAEVESLRGAKMALQELPAAEAPRSFALTPSMVAERAERPRPTVPFTQSNWGLRMRAASAAFAVFFATVVAIDAVGSTDTGSDDSGGVNYEAAEVGDRDAPAPGDLVTTSDDDDDGALAPPLTGEDDAGEDDAGDGSVATGPDGEDDVDSIQGDDSVTNSIGGDGDDAGLLPESGESIAKDDNGGLSTTLVIELILAAGAVGLLAGSFLLPRRLRGDD